ncbi:MAG: hypothetical protein HYY14_04855 [Candidatus Omnitrophica bacterium]|nr:hypothetical protein [Candidatus Omnitrophota bacterium]
MLQLTCAWGAPQSLIDYEGVNLLKSGRVMGPKHTANDKTVFCVNLSGEANEYLFGGTLSSSEKRDLFKRVKYEIFIANVDGSNQKRLTQSPEGTLSFAPRFTGDGKAIVYKEIYLTEEYLDRHPEEVFKNIPGTPKLHYTGEYAVMSGRFMMNYFRLILEDGGVTRLTFVEADAFYASQKKKK